MRELHGDQRCERQRLARIQKTARVIRSIGFIALVLGCVASALVTWDNYEAHQEFDRAMKRKQLLHEREMHDINKRREDILRKAK